MWHYWVGRRELGLGHAHRGRPRCQDDLYLTCGVRQLDTDSFQPHGRRLTLDACSEGVCRKYPLSLAAPGICTYIQMLTCNRGPVHMVSYLVIVLSIMVTVFP